MNPRSDDQQTPTTPRRRFARREQPRPGADAGESLQSVLAEVVLLREENARLKAAQHQPASLGRLLGQARSLPAPRADAEELADDAAQMLVEGMVLRESLLEVCHELEQVMGTVKTRLEALAPATEPAGRPPARDRAGARADPSADAPRAAAKGASATHRANGRARKTGPSHNRGRKGGGARPHSATAQAAKGGRNGSGDA